MYFDRFPCSPCPFSPFRLLALFEFFQRPNCRDISGAHKPDRACVRFYTQSAVARKPARDANEHFILKSHADA
jgi:hypothetical protein